MTFDIPHMIATGVVVLAVLYAVDRSGVTHGVSRRRSALVKFGAIFVAIGILNLVWPYGATAGS
ncbi:hypothetical protein DRV85_14280 [Rhodosalinus halophilus]|uniref:Uncharacterized protein n=1 Tax=Rhodosalinus halophilus TaxID=2259333 RepID=A0A365U620_9RHOB|nr:hypothetical protein [Rhodosalinus halophilus]RBI83817.1 hypothetical protein DRV85_14280 [Rhodosalinus halophilus]